MRRNAFRYVASVGLASIFLTVSSAIARDNDDRKDRSNKGGNASSNGGNNNGGGGGGSSLRSISPSGSAGQSRSSSSGDSARSSGGRSGQTIQIPSSGGSTRSFGSGSDKSTFSGKSFSAPGNRGSDSGSTATRSTVARPVDGVIQNGGGGNGGGGNGGPAFQGFPRGNQSGGNSDSPPARFYPNGPGNSTQFNRLSDSSQQPNGQPDNNSRGNAKVRNQNKDGDASNNNQNAVKRNVGGPNNPNNPNVGGPNNQPGNTLSTGSTFGNNKGDNRTGRPQQGQQGQPSNQTNGPGNDSKVSKDKVESFLQMRRDNGGGSTVGSGNNAVGGKFNRDGNNGGDGRNAFKVGQPGSDKNFGDSKKVADQSWEKRFGTGSDFGGRNKDGKPSKGNDDIRTGIGNQKGNVPGGDRSFDNRKFDKNFVDRNYQDWRKGGNDGKRDGGKDNRDWSGQWKNGDRFVAADQIRNHWKNNGKGKNMPFSKDWWDGHDHHGHNDGHWNHWDHFGDHHYHPYHWWSSCSAPRLTTWVSFGWNTPYYWDYGPGEYIYTNNGIVYVNGTWFEPAPVFYRRTVLLAQQAPVWTPAQAAQVNWLPLGVFVVARDGVADNNVLVQLAVTQEGVIGGTIFNQLTGAEFPIQGMVDKQTQRAAWTYTDDTGAQIAMESSIFNLTQPAATGLIHYGPDNIQVIELVRLEDPNAGP